MKVNPSQIEEEKIAYDMVLASPADYRRADYHMSPALRLRYAAPRFCCLIRYSSQLYFRDL